jgi:hypothetical protein
MSLTGEAGNSFGDQAVHRLVVTVILRPTFAAPGPYLASAAAGWRGLRRTVRLSRSSIRDDAGPASGPGRLRLVYIGPAAGKTELGHRSATCEIARPDPARIPPFV